VTDSRETMRRRAFRDHTAAAATATATAATEPARSGGFLPYKCPICGRTRQTTANQPPERCPTCILDHRTGTP
jgi:rubrerythrin